MDSEVTTTSNPDGAAHDTKRVSLDAAAKGDQWP
jgi:hypothetical protein